MQKWPVVKEKRISNVLYMFDLDDECIIVKKPLGQVITEICSWMPPSLDGRNGRIIIAYNYSISQHFV